MPTNPERIAVASAATCMYCITLAIEILAPSTEIIANLDSSILLSLNVMV